MAEQDKFPPKKGLKHHITLTTLRQKIKQSFSDRLRTLRAEEQDRNRNISGDRPHFNCQEQIQAIQSEMRTNFLETSPIGIAPEEVDAVMVQVVQEMEDSCRIQWQEALETMHREVSGTSTPYTCNVCHQPVRCGFLCKECYVTLNDEKD